MATNSCGRCVVCRAAIVRLLAADRFRPVGLIDELEAVCPDEVELRTVDPELATLRNLNSPAAYEQALANLEGAE